jgi:hypothetical protein
MSPVRIQSDSGLFSTIRIRFLKDFYPDPDRTKFVFIPDVSRPAFVVTWSVDSHETLSQICDFFIRIWIRIRILLFWDVAFKMPTKKR